MRLTSSEFHRLGKRLDADPFISSVENRFSFLAPAQSGRPSNVSTGQPKLPPHSWPTYCSPTSTPSWRTRAGSSSTPPWPAPLPLLPCVTRRRLRLGTGHRRGTPHPHPGVAPAYGLFAHANSCNGCSQNVPIPLIFQASSRSEILCRFWHMLMRPLANSPWLELFDVLRFRQSDSSERRPE
jgi:hypothetical protein